MGWKILQNGRAVQNGHFLSVECLSLGQPISSHFYDHLVAREGAERREGLCVWSHPRLRPDAAPLVATGTGIV